MNPVEIVEREYLSLTQYLSSNGQPSYVSDVNKYFKKILILSSASYFEHQITSILIELATNLSSSDERIINFLKKQAISQKYHQLFDWGEQDKPDKPSKSAKKFFKLFGENFQTSITSEIVSKPEIQRSMENFLEIGHLRNILVHNNFATYDFENLTSEEIIAKSNDSISFLEFLRHKLS